MFPSHSDRPPARTSAPQKSALSRSLARATAGHALKLNTFQTEDKTAGVHTHVMTVKRTVLHMCVFDMAPRASEHAFQPPRCVRSLFVVCLFVCCVLFVCWLCVVCCSLLLVCCCLFVRCCLLMFLVCCWTQAHVLSSMLIPASRAIIVLKNFTQGSICRYI